MKLFIHIILMFFLVITLELTLGLLRGFRLDWDIPLMFLKYFITSYIIYKYFRDSFKAFLIVAFFFTLLILFQFFNHWLIAKKFTSIGYANEFAALLGFYSFLFLQYTKVSLQLKIGLILSLFFLTIYAAVKWDYLAYFYGNRTFKTSKNEFISPNSYELKDRNGHRFTFEKDKLYIIDFWHSACNYCFQEFPTFNKMATNNTYADVEYIALNLPLKGDEENYPFEYIHSKGYAFPVYTCSDNTPELFHATNGFPDYAAIRNDTLLFRGYNSFIKSFLKKQGYK